MRLLSAGLLALIILSGCSTLPPTTQTTPKPSIDTSSTTDSSSQSASEATSKPEPPAASTQPEVSVSPPPQPPQSPVAVPKALKIGLALGGGAARCFAHIGVITVLEANCLVPEIVVGTGAGRLGGALYGGGIKVCLSDKFGGGGG